LEGEAWPMAKRSADKVLGTIKKKIGKSGSLTYEELGSFLGDDLDIEFVDDIYCGLSDMGIEVVDKKTHEAKRKREAKKRTKAQPRLRFDDPVRMYLREMGQVKLLDRAGEVEICKRIESAEDMTYCAIFESLTTMKRLSGLAERLRSEKVRLDKVVGVDRKKKNATGKDERRRAVNRMEKIIRLDEERRELEQKLKKARPQHATQTKKAIQRRHKSIATETKRLALHPAQVSKMAVRIGELVDKCRALEDEISVHSSVHESLLRKAERQEAKRKKARKATAGKGKTKTAASKKAKTTTRTKTPAALKKEAALALNEVRNRKRAIRRIERECGIRSDALTDMAYRIRKGEVEASIAKTEMVEANVRLVISIAKRYTHRGRRATQG